MKKLSGAAAVTAALLLTGCAAAAPQPTPTPQAADTDFCGVLATNGAAYNRVFESDTVNASDLANFELWASNLEKAAPSEIAESVADYIAPVDLAATGRDASIDAMEWTMAHNSVNQFCLTEG